MDPKTVAIGGAVAVGGLALFMMMRGGGGDGADGKGDGKSLVDGLGQLGQLGGKLAGGFIAGEVGGLADSAADRFNALTGKKEEADKLIATATELRKKYYADALVQIDVPNLNQARNDVDNIRSWNQSVLHSIDGFSFGTAPVDPLAGNQWVEELSAKIEAKANLLDVPRIPIAKDTMTTAAAQLAAADKILTKPGPIAAPEDRQAAATIKTAEQLAADLFNNKVGFDNLDRVADERKKAMDLLYQSIDEKNKKKTLEEGQMRKLALELLHVNDETEFQRRLDQYKQEWDGTGVQEMLRLFPSYRVRYKSIRAGIAFGELMQKGLPSADAMTKAFAAYQDSLGLPAWLMTNEEQSLMMRNYNYCLLFTKR